VARQLLHRLAGERVRVLEIYPSLRLVLGDAERGAVAAEEVVRVLVEELKDVQVNPPVGALRLGERVVEKVGEEAVAGGAPPRPEKSLDRIDLD
jgi:hypothetical protein